MRKHAPRAAAALLLAGALVLAVPTAASAHVRVSPGQVAAGATNVQLSFSVPTEADDAPNGETTVLLRVDFDQAHPFSSVYVQPVAGWTATALTSALPKPVKVGDTTLAQAVTSVTWTAAAGQGIPKGSFQDFVVSVSPIPDVQRLTMPATQQFSNGSVERWNQLMPHGSGTAPDHPAPVLYVNERPPTLTGGGMSGMSMGGSGTTVAASSSSSGSSSAPPVLTIVALVLGAAGLVLGLLAFLRTRRTGRA